MFLTAFLWLVDFSQGRAKRTSSKSMCSDLDRGAPPTPRSLPLPREWKFLQILCSYYSKIKLKLQNSLSLTLVITAFFFRNVYTGQWNFILANRQHTLNGWVLGGEWVAGDLPLLSSPSNPLFGRFPSYLSSLKR